MSEDIEIARGNGATDQLPNLRIGVETNRALFLEVEAHRVGRACRAHRDDGRGIRWAAWLGLRADFLDMLGASKLVPGQSSTQMAIHLGHQR